MRILCLAVLSLISLVLHADTPIACSLAPFEDSTQSVDKATGTIRDYPAARRLVLSQLKDISTFNPKSSSVMIHVVKLSKVGETTKKVNGADMPAISIAVQSSHWYAVDPKEDWSTSTTRLYGTKDPFLLVVFLEAPENSFIPTYTYTSVGRLPAPVQDLQDAVKVFQSVIGANAKGKLNVMDAKPTPSDMFCWSQFSVKAPGTIDVAPKITPNSDDATVVAIDQKPAEFDNEGFYHWDVSVGVPILSYKQLQTVAGSSGDATLDIDKRNLFLIGDWYLKAVDVKGTNFAKVPYLVGGASIASKPLHSILAGVGWGPVVANFYGGFLIITNNLPNHKTERVIKGAFGINLPVRTIMGKLGINTQTTSGK